MSALKLGQINFSEQKTAKNFGNNEETPEQLKEKKVFQQLLEIYLNVVRDQDCKFGDAMDKQPGRKHNLEIRFDKEKGYTIQMLKQQEEKQFFALMLVTQILNRPRFLMKKLCRDLAHDGIKLYHRAKELKLEFNQFYEFIDHQLSRSQYDRDLEFDLVVSEAPQAAIPQNVSVPKRKSSFHFKKGKSLIKSLLNDSNSITNTDKESVSQKQDNSNEFANIKETGLATILKAIGVNKKEKSHEQ